jgi:hypothetical protein
MQEMSNLQCWCDGQLVIDSERGLLEEVWVMNPPHQLAAGMP